MKIENLHCHSFIEELARQSTIAFDCGANNGDFAKWLSENTHAAIYSFEPDPRCFKRLPKLDRVHWEEIAIDGESGELELGLGSNACSSGVYRESNSQETILVKKITLDEYCLKNDIKTIDFLKIDIEGAELSVLENISEELLSSITQITVEFHDFIEKGDLPRIRQVVQRLRTQGFFFIRFSWNTWGDCLFLNQRKVPLSMAQKMKMFFSKYLSGAQRMGRRMLKR